MCASVAAAPSQTPAAVVDQGIAPRQHAPTWGKQRLADELAEAHGWVPLVRPTTVERLLRAACHTPGRFSW